MATDGDFIYTGDEATEQRLNAMHAALPNFDDSDPVSVVAGLIFLDNAAGKADQFHHLLIQPSLIAWLLMMVRVDHPELSALLAKINDEQTSEEEVDAAGTAADPLLTAAPFLVTFTSDDAEIEAGYPEIVRGKTLLVQAMTEEQAGRLEFFACTVDAEGKLIDLNEIKL